MTENVKCKDCDELGMDSDGIHICTITNKYLLKIDDTPLNCPKRSDES